MQTSEQSHRQSPRRRRVAAARSSVYNKKPTSSDVDAECFRFPRPLTAAFNRSSVSVAVNIDEQSKMTWLLAWPILVAAATYQIARSLFQNKKITECILLRHLRSIHNLHNSTIVATIHNYKQKIYNFLFVKTIVCKSYACNYNYLSTIICNYNCRNRFYKSTITIYKRETSKTCRYNCIYKSMVKFYRP